MTKLEICNISNPATLTIENSTMVNHFRNKIMLTAPQFHSTSAGYDKIVFRTEKEMYLFVAQLATMIV